MKPHPRCFKRVFESCFHVIYSLRSCPFVYSTAASPAYICYFACLSDGSSHDGEKENHPSPWMGAQSKRRRVALPETCRLQIREAGAPVLHLTSEKVRKHWACSHLTEINNSTKSFLPLHVLWFFECSHSKRGKQTLPKKKISLQCWLLTYLFIHCFVVVFLKFLLIVFLPLNKVLSQAL